MQHNGWDHALKVTADGAGLAGHAGAVLLRKAADQAGLTAQLSAALRKGGELARFWTGGSCWCRWRPRSRSGPPA
jgi:hypothetical protein